MKYRNFSEWWKKNGNPAWGNIREMCRNSWDSGIEKVCNQTRLDLEQENRLLREALEAVEWYTDDRCPWCFRNMEQGHSETCTRQLALNGSKNEESAKESSVKPKDCFNCGKPATHVTSNGRLGLCRDHALSAMAAGWRVDTYPEMKPIYRDWETAQQVQEIGRAHV